MEYVYAAMLLHSAEKEIVPFDTKVYPTGNVENWMGDIERMMIQSVRTQIEMAVADYGLVAE